MALPGELAPPMANGELMFDAPWQGRVFGIARVLCEQQYYSWDEFRESLIACIRRWDETHREDDPYAYYDHFLTALSELLEKKGILDIRELLKKDAMYHARPHGHDHHGSGAD